jgi:hypothetical protein
MLQLQKGWFGPKLVLRSSSRWVRGYVNRGAGAHDPLNDAALEGAGLKKDEALDDTWGVQHQPWRVTKLDTRRDNSLVRSLADKGAFPGLTPAMIADALEKQLGQK